MNVAVNYPYFIRLIQEDLNGDNPAVSTLGEAIFPWISSIKLLVPEAAQSKKAVKDTGKVKATVLIQSSKKSWITSGNFDLNPQQKWTAPPEGFKRADLAVYLTGDFNSYFTGKPIPPAKEPPPGASDSLKKILLAPNAADQNRTIVAHNKDRHLVVVGTSNFVTSQFAMPGNVTFLLNLVDWLSTDDNLITIRSRTMVDRTISKDNLKEGSSLYGFVRYTNILLMPVLVVLAGLFIFLRRREASAAPVATEKTEEKAS
jgi:ABC-type uncharacterized transport system involved in gliding motility auxiliary subunit